MAMEKTFNAAEAESRLYQAWEKAGCFTAGANAFQPSSPTLPICWASRRRSPGTSPALAHANQKRCVIRVV